MSIREFARPYDALAQDTPTEWAHPEVKRPKLEWQHEPGKSVRVEEPLAHIIAGEGDFEGALARFGHGLQRSYLLALLHEFFVSDELHLGLFLAARSGNDINIPTGPTPHSRLSRGSVRAIHKSLEVPPKFVGRRFARMGDPGSLEAIAPWALSVAPHRPIRQRRFVIIFELQSRSQSN